MKIIIFCLFLLKSLSAEMLVMPQTCNDLLPDMAEYIDFAEEVATFWSHSDQAKSLQIYEVLSIRNMYQKSTLNFDNPIDELIRKSFCDCYVKNGKKLFNSNSDTIRTFLSENLADLKKKAQDAYIDLQLEKKLREYTIAYTKKNRALVKEIKKQALLNTKKELNELLDKKVAGMPRI